MTTVRSGFSMVLMYVFVQQVSAQPVNSPLNSEIESASEPGNKLMFDSGYGSRIQTGSRLAKWREMSNLIYGKYGPGRKRSVPVDNGQIVQPMERPNGYGNVADVFGIEREIKYRHSFYMFRLLCLELLEKLWKKSEGNIKLFMNVKNTLDNICL